MYVVLSELMKYMDSYTFFDTFFDTATGEYYTVMNEDEKKKYIELGRTFKASKKDLKYLNTYIVDLSDKEIPDTYLQIPNVNHYSLILEFLEQSKVIGIYQKDPELRRWIERVQHSVFEFHHDLALEDKYNILGEYEEFIQNQLIKIAIDWCEENGLKYTLKR